MPNLRAVPSEATRRAAAIRLAIAVPLALALLLATLPVADASAKHGPKRAKHGVKVVVSKMKGEPGRIRFAARGARSHKRVAFYVDGRRRWVDRRFQWRFRRKGHLRIDRMRPGRHRLTVKARHRHGRVSRSTRVIYVSPADRGGTVTAKGGNGKGKGNGLDKTKPSKSDPEPTTEEPTTEEPTTEEPAPTAEPLVDAGFEDGFLGWNMNGVGDVEPTIVGDLTRAGSRSSRVVLTGSQDRSELMLDGEGSALGSGTVQFYEGDEYHYAFSFNVRSMVYGRPGAHNLLMQFKSDGTGSPNFGLMLWDYDGKRGLWSHSEAMGGDRYLAPISHDRWHDVRIHFRASRAGEGFYRLYLDGALIDARDNVSMIRTDRTFGYIKTGLYRNGGQIPGTSEIRLDSGLLGETAEQATVR